MTIIWCTKKIKKKLHFSPLKFEFHCKKKLSKKNGPRGPFKKPEISSGGSSPDFIDQ